eukprot:126340_1
MVHAIEKINTQNIVNNAWIIVTDLVYPADGPRAVLYETDYILTIGGWRAFSPHVANEYIQIIDTNTNNVFLASSPLNFPAVAASVLMVSNKIYKFGGETAPKIDTNQWESV